MGRTGYVSGTLAVREGLRAPVPAIDPRAILTMHDMGHGGMQGMGGHDMPTTSADTMAGTDHGAMTAEPGSQDMSGTSHNGHDMSAMPGASMAGMDHGAGRMQEHPAREARNPLVDMQTMAPMPKLDDPGIGLRANGRKVLTYAALKTAFDDPDGREPGRTIELHLTGHMQKFAWSFDGIKFSGAEPLRLNYGERLRIVLVNDTMMTHPIHLHGMWSDVEDEHGNFHLRKHTVDMPPGSKRSYRVRADALGRWAYHCHLLYHMEAGMMREVMVKE
jgi:CopA family copper-resistance protein